MSSLEVATTIARQLGYSTARMGVMIGAHSFSGDANSLTFKFKAKARNSSNCLKVTLDPSDTYTVEFYRVRAGTVKVVKSYSDIYADSLKGLFESETGLYLSL